MRQQLAPSSLDPVVSRNAICAAAPPPMAKPRAQVCLLKTDRMGHKFLSGERVYRLCVAAVLVPASEGRGCSRQTLFVVNLPLSCRVSREHRDSMYPKTKSCDGRWGVAGPGGRGGIPGACHGTERCDARQRSIVRHQVARRR